MPEKPDAGGGKLADPEWRRSRASKAGRARTTPDYHLDRIRELVARTRAEQGLDAVVVDELTLGHVAELLRGADATHAVAS